MLRITSITIILGAIFLFANEALAASIFWIPSTGEYSVSKEIVADLKIDSEDLGINAGQATIRFPKDILEVKSVDKTNSAFNFWLEEPSFSNTDGAITFVGGTPYGISGASIQVLRVVFVAKSNGLGTLSFADSAVTASDGSGTNVLSKTTDATFTISPTVGVSIITPPTQIKREPIAPTGLPIKPVVSVPLYPDGAEWYGHSNVFNATWRLPNDVSGVATALNREPYYNPRASEGLFDNKMFQALPDGIWYLHVRFQNDIGWGATSHYRIGVDTQAPLPFEITSNESVISDDPNLTLYFKTSDAVSGISKYQIKTGDGNWTIIPVKDFKGTFSHHHGEPGKHSITIRAVDAAGNSIENTIDHEVLPLASPTFTFSTQKLFSDEPMGLSFKGTALPSTNILLLIKRSGALVAGNTVHADANGNWEFAFGEPLRNGRYIASIQNVDARGALSLVVTAPEIQVTGRYTNITIVVLIVLLGAIIGGYLFYKKHRERTILRVELAERDTSNVFKMIKTDIQKLEDANKTATPADDEFITEKLKKNVEKMSSYVRDEIGRAKE